MLLRNNYRIFALNELIVCACDQMNVRVLDLFSWSLSVGCRHYGDAVHLDKTTYNEFAKTIAREWMPAGALG